MVLHNLFIGKGIFLPLEVLVRKYRGILWDTSFSESKIMEEPQEAIEMIQVHLEEVYGEDIRCEHMRNDVFDDGFRALDRSQPHKIAIEQVKNLGNTKNMMFIGIIEYLEGSKNVFCLSEKELPYSMPLFLPKLVETYNRFQDRDLEFLKNPFGQEPLIWTFSYDYCLR